MVSIIIPTFNRDFSIARSIQSVLNQTYEKFDVLVIDDGSTDSTEDVVKSISDKRIKYIKMPENGGAAAARNQGVRLAKGDFVAFQDSDDEWEADKLEKQLKCFETQGKSVGMVYTDMLRISIDGSKRIFSAPDVLKGRIMDLKELEYQVFGIGQQSVIMRKQCFESVGYFDESLPRFIDLEFFVRLLLKYQAIRIPEPLVRFYETEGISSNKAACIEARQKLLEKYKKHYSCKFKASQLAKMSEFYYLLGNQKAGLKHLIKALLLSPTCVTVWRTLRQTMIRNRAKINYPTSTT